MKCIITNYSMLIEIRPRSCVISIRKRQRRLINLNIKKHTTKRSHPAIVLKQRTRTVPSVRLVNRVLQIAPRRRTLRKNSSQRRTERRDRPQELLIPSQAIASNEMSARLQRLGERPRLVAVIRMPTLTTTSLMRILLVHFQRNQYNIMFPDQDYLRSQIEHLIGSNRGSGNSGSDTRH